VDQRRWNSVRMQKEKELLIEVKKMNKKESQAKKLEHLESKILKRLRETHSKQQTAIQEINKIFSLNHEERYGATPLDHVMPDNINDALENDELNEEREKVNLDS